MIREATIPSIFWMQSLCSESFACTLQASGGEAAPDALYKLYCIELVPLDWHYVQVGHVGEKRLIERRRPISDQPSPERFFEHDPPYNRRESDQLRVRLERWSELADAALGANVNGNGRINRVGKANSRAKAAN